MANEHEVDDDWPDDQPQPKRRGIPGWAMFCGGGCLLALLLVVVLVVVLVVNIKRATDHELQRANLEEVLPYDELPESMQVFGWDLFVKGFVINDSRGYMWGLYVDEDATEADKQAFFANPDAVDPVFGAKGIEGVEFGEAVVQGETLQVKRFMHSGSDILNAVLESQGRPAESEGASIFVDLPTVDGEGMLLLMLVAIDADELISDQQLGELLAPFHIGPDRTSVPPVLPPGPEEDSAEDDERDPEEDGE